MAQQLHVVRCVQCDIFQVQIVKKSSNKWECKVCKKKQSILQVFGTGDGKECRQICQALNTARGQLEEAKFRAEVNSLSTSHEPARDRLTEAPLRVVSDSTSSGGGTAFVPPSRSKWTKYCDDSSQSEFLLQ